MADPTETPLPAAPEQAQPTPPPAPAVDPLRAARREGGDVAVVDAYGNVQRVSADELPRALDQGYKVADAGAINAQVREEVWGGTAGTLAAGAAGVLRGVSGGLSDVAYERAGLARAASTLRDVNPGASLVGEIGGNVLSMATPLGKGIGAVGGLAEKGVARLAGRGLLSGAARATAEGALSGMQTAISEAALGGDYSRLGELLSAHVGLGGAIGAGAGLGLGVLGKGVGAGLRKLARDPGKRAVAGVLAGADAAERGGIRIGEGLASKLEGASSVLGSAERGGGMAELLMSPAARHEALNAADIMSSHVDDFTRELSEVHRTAKVAGTHFTGEMKTDEIRRLLAAEGAPVAARAGDSLAQLRQQAGGVRDLLAKLRSGVDDAGNALAHKGAKLDSIEEALAAVELRAARAADTGSVDDLAAAYTAADNLKRRARPRYGRGPRHVGWPV